MDCNYTTIKTCELKGSTFRSRLLDFGNFNISDYTFSVEFINSLGQKITSEDLIKTGNIVTVPLTAIQTRSGRINAVVWMESPGGFKDKVIVFDVVISATGCPSDASITEGVSVTFGGMKVPVQVHQGIVNISMAVDFDSFTPDNILVLQQPAIEAAGIANAAANNANTAKDAANSAASSANGAATNATNAANASGSAAANANNAANLATGAIQETVTATGQAIAAANAAENQAAAAQTAANNANTAAGSVQTAITAATNAATAANSAATAAANAKGWSPHLVTDATTIPGKTLLKLSDWIGGTGTKPTTNVGQWQKADGTYTAVASEANDIKGATGTSVNVIQATNQAEALSLSVANPNNIYFWV